MIPRPFRRRHRSTTPTTDRLQRELTRHRNYSLLTPAHVLVHKNTEQALRREAEQAEPLPVRVVADARQEVPEGEFWFVVRLPRA